MMIVTHTKVKKDLLHLLCHVHFLSIFLFSADILQYFFRILLELSDYNWLTLTPFPDMETLPTHTSGNIYKY